MFEIFFQKDRKVVRAHAIKQVWDSGMSHETITKQTRCNVSRREDRRRWHLRNMSKTLRGGELGK